jgi:methionyl-tRNA synthetase
MKEPTPLFPRVDLKEFLAEEAKREEAKQTAPSSSPKTEGIMDYISFDEFKKMDLRVALVLKAEKVEGAQKLIKLQIDIGTEQRQIVAGIAETYKPEELVGKRLIVIVNLKPAVIRGIESQGAPRHQSQIVFELKIFLEAGDGNGSCPEKPGLI